MTRKSKTMSRPNIDAMKRVRVKNLFGANVNARLDPTRKAMKRYSPAVNLNPLAPYIISSREVRAISHRKARMVCLLSCRGVVRSLVSLSIGLSRSILVAKNVPHGAERTYGLTYSITVVYENQPMD